MKIVQGLVHHACSVLVDTNKVGLGPTTMMLSVADLLYVLGFNLFMLL